MTCSGALSGVLMGPSVGPNGAVVRGTRWILFQRGSGAVWRERYMSIVLLLLFALSVVYTGLRAAWERGPGHDFLKAKPNDREQLVPGVLGMFLLVAWFWEVPSSSGWWYLLLALLALWLALSMLYALGAALIHPEQLRLSSRHARSPAAAFPAGKESKPRGPSILAFLAGAALFLVVFAELLPDEAIELRHNVAIGLLLVMAASGVMLGWVLFRPWSIIRQHPNQEDAQAFCLLVMMLFFHAALLATPAEHEERMAVFGFGTVLLIMASLLAFGRRKTGAGHSRVQAGSSALCALCMPVSLMCGVMLVPEVHVQEPSLTAVQRAAIAHQEAREFRERQHALQTGVPPSLAQAPVNGPVQGPEPVMVASVPAGATTGMDAPGAGPALNPETKPDTGTAAKPDIRAETKSEAKPVTASGVKLDSKEVMRPEMKPGTERGAKPDTRQETVSGMKPQTVPHERHDSGTATPVGEEGQVRSVESQTDEGQPSQEARLMQIVQEKLRVHFEDDPAAVRITRNKQGAFRIQMRSRIFYIQPENENVVDRVAARLYDSLHAVAAEGVRMAVVDMQIWTKAKDRYGNPLEKAVFSLSLRDPDLSRINWAGIDREKLLDLVQVVWQPDGLAAARAYCRDPVHRYESSGFCAAAFRQDVARGTPVEAWQVMETSDGEFLGPTPVLIMGGDSDHPVVPATKAKGGGSGVTEAIVAGAVAGAILSNSSDRSGRHARAAARREAAARRAAAAERREAEAARREAARREATARREAAAQREARARSKRYGASGRASVLRRLPGKTTGRTRGKR